MSNGAMNAARGILNGLGIMLALAALLALGAYFGGYDW